MSNHAISSIQSTTPSVKNAIVDTAFLLFTPIVYLNAFAGLVGGIGLAVRGEWVLIAIGIAAIVISPLLIAALSCVSLVFFIPSVELIKHGNLRISGLLFLIGSLIIAAIHHAWTILPFWATYDLLASQYHWTTSLWCYEIAICPIAYLASKTTQPSLSDASLFVSVCSVAAIVMCQVLSLISVEVVIAGVGFAILCQVIIAHYGFGKALPDGFSLESGQGL